MKHVLVLAMMFVAGFSLAETAEVVAIRAANHSGNWRFDVTVRHADAGWDHYADTWEVAEPDGKVLATRVLLHPHDTEQPFTRSLTGIEIPDGLTEVLVRAHDSVHGWGDAVRYQLPR